jgi:hypothetical protein
MPGFRASLTVLAAALYVLLGISASWHGMHFTRGETSIGVDQHGHHEAHLDGESCALCSTKKSAHAASSSYFHELQARVLGGVAYVGTDTLLDAVIGSDRARAPPVFS